MTGGLSADSYLDRRLRTLDSENYSAAGLLPYRKGSNGLEFLFAMERPWNSFTNSYDPLSWNIFGGKRIPRQERAIEATAIRCFLDAVGQAPGAPENDVMYRLMADSFAVWYALGKFALLMVEVTGDDISVDFPSKYLEWKQSQPSSEFSMTSTGIKKWTKQIDALEWVPATDLVPAAKKDVSDLLGNILQISGFREFLEGSLDPASFPDRGGPVPRPPPMDNFKGKGKSKDKGKGKGKGKDKGYKGQPMAKGMPMYSGPPPGKGGFVAPMPPMMMPAYDQQNNMELQRQMYGEQLYLMVQPMSPSPYIAQKITGMLLELPNNELMLNLTNHEELQRRVTEAVEVLKEDGIFD
jgi:hypothetical protein